jgi:hypothetical protein
LWQLSATGASVPPDGYPLKKADATARDFSTMGNERLSRGTVVGESGEE